MTAFSRLSRFGMTYKPLTEDRGAELLTLYLAAFPARTLVQQEKVMDWTESEAECGTKWRGWLAKLCPDTFLWKTAQCSLIEGEQESLEILPRWGMTRNGLLWELPMLEPITRGTGSGSLVNILPPPPHQTWPTPTAHMSKETNAPSENKRNTPTLTAQANWATPTVCGNHNRKGASKTSGDGLATQVGGKLNPMWVEWLMGWPLGWTDLKPLATDKSHCVQQQHGIY
jgi:hypothetical protein